MINIVWLGMIGAGIITALLNGNMNEVSNSIFNGAEESVKIIIKLIAPMTLWLGILNIAREAGLTKKIANFIKPLFKFLFSSIPANSEAAGAIIMNLSANLLGMGNSTTPLGIKAMQELNKLNTDKSIASPAMCTLLALNTSSVTIIPATIISLRASYGSINPAIIIFSTFIATSISTITAIILDKSFRIFYGE